MLNYPVKYLNKINYGTLLFTKLELKIGYLIMVLKNLNAPNGVCNSSKGILTRHSNKMLKVRLLTGQHAG
ncbi:MAG TPA: hypothetical protein VEP90_11785 [Methylomirabilota bacterium]|nr:hypothetical protein [Methylomirabilota bacterium]